MDKAVAPIWLGYTTSANTTTVIEKFSSVDESAPQR